MIKKPIPTLWANDRLAVMRGFALIAAGSLAFNTFFIFMPNHLAATRKLDVTSMLAVSAAMLAVTAAAAVLLAVSLMSSAGVRWQSGHASPWQSWPLLCR